MRIALFSDIHANLAALNAALAEAGRAGADRIMVAGDVVGDGPWPAETIDRMADLGLETVRGNVDRDVVTMSADADRLGQMIRHGRRANRAWTVLQLDAARRRWLWELPERVTVTVEGRHILVLHGSPLGDTDYIYPTVTGRSLRRKLAGLRAPRPDVLVCGHSHLPFARQASGGVFVINAGSVGRPKDGDPRGAFALLDLDEAQRHPPRARIVRFDYDVDSLLDAARERGVPGVRPDEYRFGVKLKRSDSDRIARRSLRPAANRSLSPRPRPAP